MLHTLTQGDSRALLQVADSRRGTLCFVHRVFKEIVCEITF